MPSPFGASPLVVATYSSGSEVAVAVSEGSIATALGSAFTVGFQQEVASALAGVSLAVLGEDGSLANAASRKNLARIVNSNPPTYTATLIYAITADGMTGAASTDQQLYNRILGIWDLLCYGF